MAKAGKEGIKFERKLSELEEIVSRLESGEIPLEDSLALFEKGTGILKELTRILEEAEKRVDVLTRDMEGSLEVEPFLEEGEE